MSDELTHFDREGNAIMVDVTAKSVTHRRAEARCRVGNIVNGATLVSDASASELLCTARVAGLQAAKLTSSLIPLCHPLPLREGSIVFSFTGTVLEISSVVTTDAETGVEMEALTACAGAALSVVAELRGVDPDVIIDALALVDKVGGRSGHWRRVESDEPSRS